MNPTRGLRKSNKTSTSKKTLGFDKFLEVVKEELFSPEYFGKKENIGIRASKFEKDPLNLIWEECLKLNSQFISPLFNYKYYLSQIGKKEQELTPIEALYHYFNDCSQGVYKKPIVLFDTAFYVRSSSDLGDNPLLDYIRKDKVEQPDPNPLFHTSYYYKLYPNLIESPISGIQHYMEFGHKERRLPNELFDTGFVRRKYGIPYDVNPLEVYLSDNSYGINQTSTYFNGEYFLRFNKHELDNDLSKTPLELFYKNSDKFHLVTSRGFDPKLYQEEYGPVRQHALLDFLANEERKAFIHINDAIREQIGEAVELDPRIVRAHKGLEDLMQYSQPYISRSLRLIRKAKENVDLNQKFDVIVLLSTMRRGGAEWYTLKIVNSILEQTDKKVLLVYTDHVKAQSAEWVPQSPNLQLLNFEELVPKATQDDRIQVLVNLISSSKPEFVLNTNSFFGWNLYLNYGKSLSQITKLDACLFCYDYDVNNKKCGYPVDYLVDCMKYMDKILTDNYHFKYELKKDFGFSSEVMEHIKVLHFPPDYSLSRVDMKSIINKLDKSFYGRRPSFCWASRICQQKRPDLLLRIAEKCPNVDFNVWGVGNLNDFLPEGMQVIPDNVKVKGPFNGLLEVNYVNDVGFLYTAQWDGLPNIVLDFLNLGLPVVAPNIGDISKIVNIESGWLIEQFDDIDAFVSAIQIILKSPDKVKSKLQHAQEILDTRHGNDQFKNILETINYL